MRLSSPIVRVYKILKRRFQDGVKIIETIGFLFHQSFEDQIQLAKRPLELLFDLQNRFRYAIIEIFKILITIIEDLVLVPSLAFKILMKELTYVLETLTLKFSEFKSFTLSETVRINQILVDSLTYVKRLVESFKSLELSQIRRSLLEISLPIVDKLSYTLRDSLRILTEFLEPVSYLKNLFKKLKSSESLIFTKSSLDMLLPLEEKLKYLATEFLVIRTRIEESLNFLRKVKFKSTFQELSNVLECLKLKIDLRQHLFSFAFQLKTILKLQDLTSSHKESLEFLLPIQRLAYSLQETFSARLKSSKNFLTSELFSIDTKIVEPVVSESELVFSLSGFLEQSQSLEHFALTALGEDSFSISDQVSGELHHNHSDTSWSDEPYQDWTDNPHEDWSDTWEDHVWSDHSNWEDHYIDHDDSWTDDPHQDWTDHYLDHSDHADETGDPHQNWADHYIDHDDYPYHEDHNDANWTDGTHSDWTDYTDYSAYDDHNDGNWNDSPHQNWTDHIDAHEDHSDGNWSDGHQNWGDSHSDSGWEDQPPWSDHSNWTDHNDWEDHYNDWDDTF